MCQAEICGVMLRGTRFTYDDCGRLASERMSNGVTRRYTYNIHGWPELTETVVPVELQADKDSVVTILPHLSPSYYRRIIGGIDTAHVEPFNPPPSVKPIAFTKTYTDRLLYTDGAHPRYGGSPSARINSLGGRYDYSYDPHDRLLRAYYTPGEKAAEGEDFTVTYSYDELSRPTDVDRSGVVSVDADGMETFGMLDELTYRYGESGALESIEGEHEGEEYYGRPGFSPRDGTYTWNNAGCMKSDSSRGIGNITYDYRNLPTSVEFEDGSKLQHYYNAEGALLRSMVRRSATGVGLIGSTMKTVSSRDYIADRVFNKGKLEYSYFPGGYFDGTGGLHFLHSDYQGSVVMVTDSAGRVEQHNTYYPYGEPHRLPSGQRRLYCGKERESVTGEYDYGARLHFAPGLLWTVPDALADRTPDVSPYVFCNANPVRNIDLEGKLTIFVNGMHAGDGGSSAYWSGVDKVVMNYTNDNHVKYIDGSIGGALQTATHLTPLKHLFSNTKSYVRKVAGYTAGKNMAESIMSSLEEGESIRFVTHSMGAAYTKGFIKGMISALGTEVTDRIEYEVDIAPYQTDEQSAVPGVFTGTMQHRDDRIAGSEKMEGVIFGTRPDKHTSWCDLLTAHSINSFIFEIEIFLDKLNDEIDKLRKK